MQLPTTLTVTAKRIWKVWLSRFGISKAEESAESVVPGTVRAAAEQAENFLHGTRLTAGMVSAFIENVFVHDGGRIVVRFKYEQSIQDAVKALHTG